MKQINFKELQVEVSIGKKETTDASKKLGDVLYQVATDLPMDALARQIYYSDGPIDISEEDYLQMLKLFDGVLLYKMINAIKDNTNETETEKCTS